MAIFFIIAMSIWCILWEGHLAPIGKDSSLLILKGLPIIIPIFGLLRNSIKTYQYTLLLLLPYFIEGVFRGYAENGIHRLMAIGEIIISLLIYMSLLAAVKSMQHRYS